jgi:hypothetical protein
MARPLRSEYVGATAGADLQRRVDWALPVLRWRAFEPGAFPVKANS